jgi:hypothetical protein
MREYQLFTESIEHPLSVVALAKLNGCEAQQRPDVSAE